MPASTPVNVCMLRWDRVSCRGRNSDDEAESVVQLDGNVRDWISRIVLYRRRDDCWHGTVVAVD